VQHERGDVHALWQREGAVGEQAEQLLHLLGVGLDLLP
jgi:hypothetical protein